MEKFQTLEQVFSHNFEALRPWRHLRGVPHRLPDGVRFFIAPQLAAPEAISRLYVDAPESAGANDTFAFPDHSVLWRQHDIFDDEETYQLVSNDPQSLAWLAAVAGQIDDLETRAMDPCFNQAGLIAESLASLQAQPAGLVQLAVAELIIALDQQLAAAFIASRHRPEFARRWRALAGQALKQGLQLTLSPAAEAAWQRLPKARHRARKASGRSGPVAPRPRRTGPARQRESCAMKLNAKIIYHFDRELHILQDDYHTLLQGFNATAMSAAALRRNYDCLLLDFSGFADETRPPFVVPEIRRFLRRLRQDWPFASFFCHLSNRFIAIEILAHIDGLRVIERDGVDDAQLYVPPASLRKYVAQSHAMLDGLGPKAGMTRAQIRARKQCLDDYILRACGPWK